jgi:arylsulfatase
MQTRLARLAATILALLALAPATSLAQQRPNIVFMMADNLGYGDLGSYGGGEIRGMPTPRIDQLAAEGLRFTQFLVEPGCTPTRAAVMTGRYSIRSGLSLALVRGTPNTLADDEHTMAEMLKALGYDTAYLGKWHLGMDAQSLPHNQGFDSYYGILNSTDEAQFAVGMQRAGYTPSEAERAYIWEGIAGEDAAARPVREYTLDARRVIDVELADRAVEYIETEANDDEPFFLFLSWTRPHYPNLTSGEFEGRSRIGIYGDSVMELDHNTGRVLDAIEAAGIEDDTIVIWMSDNGPWRTMVWPDGGSSGPFRGELGSAWEGSIRTAGMIRWPGRIEPGVSNGMFAAMDFMPTLAGILGGAMPEDRPIDGIDQSEWLLGNQERSNRESLITFIGGDLAAVRWRNFRIYPQDVVPAGEGYIRMGGTQAARIQTNGYPRIFNIELDPREEHDTGPSESWVVGPYMRVISGYLATLEDHPNPPPSNFTDF